MHRRCLFGKNSKWKLNPLVQPLNDDLFPPGVDGWEPRCRTNADADANVAKAKLDWERGALELKVK